MFGDILKELRDDHEDTQASLAAKLDIAKSTVSNWEQGKTEPCIEMLCRICDLYDVTADYLLGRTADDPLLRQKRHEALNDENRRTVRQFENYLLYEQKKKCKK